jgi:NADH-quinone oxidoreductase subunit J
METWQHITFWVVAAGMTASAIRVVTTRNVVHAALYLVGTLLGVAVMFILMMAPFVGWAQVLIYVGAIVVLMLFGLMLTRAPIGSADFDNNQRPLALVCAVGLFVVMTTVILGAFDDERINLTRTEAVGAEEVGGSIFTEYLLPFEVLAVLLLAALIGATLLSRRDEGDEG